VSSALFFVRVLAIGGREVDLDCVSSGASALDDLCTTPAFALMALCDAAYRSPLQDEVDALGGDLCDPAWMRAHVGAFVASTRLMSRRNAIGEPALYVVMAEIEALGLSGQAEIDELRRRGHGYVLRVRVTDPRWRSHLQVGQDFATVGYDVLEDAAT
jgi:hypothetical protein